MQRRKGPLHRVLAEPTGVMKALAEPNDAAKAVEDAKATASRCADEEPAVVGAKIDGSEDRPDGSGGLLFQHVGGDLGHCCGSAAPCTGIVDAVGARGKHDLPIRAGLPIDWAPCYRANPEFVGLGDSLSAAIKLGLCSPAYADV